MNLLLKNPDAAACYGQSFRCINATHYQKCAPFDGKYPRRTTASSSKLRCPTEQNCDDRADNPCEFFSIHSHKLKWPHRIIFKRPNLLRNAPLHDEEEGPEDGTDEVAGPEIAIQPEVDSPEHGNGGGGGNEGGDPGPDNGDHGEESGGDGDDGDVVDEKEGEVVQESTTSAAPQTSAAAVSTEATVPSTLSPSIEPPNQIPNVVPTFEDNCSSVGRAPYPRDCEKYILCTRSNILINNCPRDFAFNRNTNNCVRDWSSCPFIGPCRYSGQKLTAPGDSSGFLLCVARFSGDRFSDEEQQRLPGLNNFRVFKRNCPNGEIFDTSLGTCN